MSAKIMILYTISYATSNTKMAKTCTKKTYDIVYFSDVVYNILSLVYDIVYLTYDIVYYIVCDVVYKNGKDLYQKHTI